MIAIADQLGRKAVARRRVEVLPRLAERQTR